MDKRKDTDMVKAPMNRKQLKAYCIDRLHEIEMINYVSHTPSAFVCIAAFIDFLSSLAFNPEAKVEESSERYKKFVVRYLSKYEKCAYDFYHTFRCGIIHAMSFYRKKKGKRNHLPKVVITHDLNYGKRDHVEKYHENGFDAIKIYAFDLCEDIRRAIDVMFDSKAENNPAYQNCLKYIKQQPPIGGLMCKGEQQK